MSKLLVDEISDADNTGPVTVTDGLTVQGAFTSLGIDDNATSTAITLDASGNLLVGTTSFTGTSGVSLSATGYVYASSTNDVAIYANRETSHGDIAVFRKDGTTVGSIGSSYGRLKVSSVDTGLIFGDAFDEIYPISNGITTLGDAGARFKDLYLSGGVYLGGTGAANYLDDYEEGTWTPVLKLGGIAGTDNTSSYLYANYTKVGNIVQINVSVNMLNTISGTGHLVITGLPFEQVASSIMPWRANDNMNTSNVICQTTGTALVFYNISTSTSGSLTDYTHASINSTAAGKVILVSGTYRVYD
jgi:hypothetical protein